MLALPIAQNLDYSYDAHSESLLFTIAFSSVASTHLRSSNFSGNTLLSEPGNSCNFLYDFFMGRGLNSRLGNFDWKECCKLRPVLLGRY